MKRLSPKWMALTACVVASSPAGAHTGEGLQGGFLSGFLHPMTGPDHLLAMVTVGIWGAILGRPLLYALPIVFPVVMAAAGVAAIVGLELPSVEVGIATSVIVLGAAVALNWSPHPAIAMLIVGVFALFHGWAHGTELPSLADPVAYSAGFVTATGSLHLAGVGVGAIDKLTGGRLVLRTLGALMFGAGLWFARLALR